MTRDKGFTLLELVVVIVILGILVTLGIKQYIPARERAMAREAVSNLRLIAAAEKVYKMETGKYYPNATTVNNVTSINDELKLSLMDKNWNYSIIGAVSTFNATASRVGSGGYLDCSFSVNQTQTDPVVSTTPCLQ